MYDVIVIGAGQAGLATAHYLQQFGINFIILDAANKIGDSWRNRYDSLQLFTPKMYSSLPGFPLKGHANAFPTKDEIADYLFAYAQYYQFPIQLQCNVLQMIKTDGLFQIETNIGNYKAKQVVVATGPFHHKIVPEFSALLSSEITQFHSSEYKNPLQLRAGSTLIVGAGNSGSQIAVELAKHCSNNNVYLSTSRPIHFKPLTICKRSIFWYFNKLGLLRATKETIRGKWVFNQPEAVYGYELKQLISKRLVTLMPRSVNARQNIVEFEDGNEITVSNIIWATGFTANYSWIDIDNAHCNGDISKITHSQGSSHLEGLHYVGLPWQTSRGSALIGWVQYDAKNIVARIHQLFLKNSL